MLPWKHPVLFLAEAEAKEEMGRLGDKT